MQYALGQNSIFAIGDMHGCYRQLVELIARLPFEPLNDRLVFLGDYINRGPQSREVIDYLLELQARCPQSIFLIGNHEHALLSYAATADLVVLQNMRNLGIEATLQSYGNAPVRSLLDLSFLPHPHLEFLQSLELCFEAGPYLFTHADTADLDKPWRQLDELLASRRLAGDGAPQSNRMIVFDQRVGLRLGAHAARSAAGPFAALGISAQTGCSAA